MNLAIAGRGLLHEGLAAGRVSGDAASMRKVREIFTATPRCLTFLVIESQASELRRSHPISERVIRTLGAVFQWLAVVPAAIGLVSVVQLLSGAENSLLAGLLGEWSRGGLLPRGGNEFSRLLLPVGLPVLSGSLCFRLGC